MRTIGELLTRDLDRPIEEVIKVGQQDEATVHNEISEYVFTERLMAQYNQILRAMADGPADPNENVGVWVSGFFGSGKSSFAKNLGYVLANYEILGERASDLFLKRLREQAPADPDADRLERHLRFVNARIPV